MQNLIDIEEFKKLDIRIGRIVRAERVPRTTKLLRLEVDVGGEIRQLVAGIADGYSPSELIDKLIVVLVNLRPRIIRGIVSQGMLLAVDVGGKPVLLTTDKPVPPGSRVR